MSGRIRIKCCHCQQLFTPDARNATRQRYCSKTACRKHSKADSQRRWLQKPENRDYFRGQVHVLRVKRWRAAHPGYWRKAKRSPVALQDPLIEEKKRGVRSSLLTFTVEKARVGRHRSHIAERKARWLDPCESVIPVPFIM